MVSASAAICTDEARHADYAMRMAEAHRTEVPIPVDKDLLEAPSKKDVTLEDIDAVVLHVAAISETLACGLVSACLRPRDRAATRPVHEPRRRGRCIDARFGWHYLAWRAPRWSRAERDAGRPEARNVVGIEERFWRGREPRPRRRTPRAPSGSSSPRASAASFAEMMERRSSPRSTRSVSAAPTPGACATGRPREAVSLTGETFRGRTEAAARAQSGRTGLTRWPDRGGTRGRKVGRAGGRSEGWKEGRRGGRKGLRAGGCSGAQEERSDAQEEAGTGRRSSDEGEQARTRGRKLRREERSDAQEEARTVKGSSDVGSKLGRGGGCSDA